MPQPQTTRWTISASPVYGQDIERCLASDDVEDSLLRTSYPGSLDVWLRPGVSREAAIAIAECLRTLSGEPMTVTVGQVDDDGTRRDESGQPLPPPPAIPRPTGESPTARRRREQEDG